MSTLSNTRRRARSASAASADTSTAAFLGNPPGNGSLSRPVTPEIACFDATMAKRALEGDRDQDASSSNAEHENGVVTRIKHDLRQASKTNSTQEAQDSQGEPADDCAGDRGHKLSSNDVPGLPYHSIRVNGRQKRRQSENKTCLIAESTSNALFDQNSTTANSWYPAAASGADPATTINIPEASFIPAVPTDEEDPSRRKSATTTTLLSKHNVTEVVWMPGPGHQSEPALDPESMPCENNGCNERRCSSLDAQAGCDVHGPKHSDPNTSDLRFKTGHLSTDGKPRTLRKSVVFVTPAEEGHGPTDTGSSQTGRKVSVLTRLRKKSVDIGQAVGSFVNGGYRNADYKPRRESSAVRMRAILQQLEPARPKQDFAVFAAMTGAQPIEPVDYPEPAGQRPSLSRQSCSEDRFQHICVQHETIPD